MANVPLFRGQLLLLLLRAIAALARSDTLHPHCQESCGNFSIPYPFGIGPECYRDKSFEITCKKNDANHILMPHSGGIDSTLPVFNFSVSQSQATFPIPITYDCYNGSSLVDSHKHKLNLKGTPFVVSAARSKFTAIGCNTVAYFSGNRTKSIWDGGCMTFCESGDMHATNDSSGDGSCTGGGCCQTSLPENLDYYQLGFTGRTTDDTTWEYNPCSYYFVAENFKFDVSYLKKKDFRSAFPYGTSVGGDWLVKNITCEEAMKNISSYACRSSHSECRNHNSTNGIHGYTCNCSPGYEGNPYLKDTCQDIDECRREELNHCPPGSHCRNIPGNYTCECSSGYSSEDPPTNKKCDPDPSLPDPSLPLWIKLVIGIGIFIILLLILTLWACLAREKRKLAEEKKRFFHQNGGLLLYEELRYRGEGIKFKIYKTKELEEATNNFDMNLVLGRGGYGTVYRGILKDNQIVAIKKAKTIDEAQKEEFVKEILILSQINHNNVVKLLGCCLEVEVPMLVYEYVANGTLHDYIHDKRSKNSIPLSTRLKIAEESATALTYLHSAASPPILHRDVKSSNILLDENYSAKVSDFGASILAAVDKAQLMTVVQGTYGYLDPEYMQTFVFTEKSDVYSFGVVLLELITKKEANYVEGSEQKNLASIFVSLMKQGRVGELFDDQLMSEGQGKVLQEIAELVKECLSIKGEERPTMKEVMEELQSLVKLTQPRSWGQHNHHPEEQESLLGESLSCNEARTSGCYILGNSSVLNIEGGR